MKKLLVVLLILVFAAPLPAPPIPPKTQVLVYKWKESVTGIGLTPGWNGAFKDNLKGYAVVEVDGRVMYVTIIETWTEKIKGQTYKLMNDWDDEFELIREQVSGKDMWIITAWDDESRVLMSGMEKVIKIDDQKNTEKVATKLTGIVLFDEMDGPDERYLGTVKSALSLDTKTTVEANSDDLDAEGTYNLVVDKLQAKGYEWD